MKLRKGDEVKVTAGRDKGKSGKVEKVLLREHKVVVSGINMYKRHYKPRKQGEKGGIIDIIKPLSVASISLLCPKCKSVTRIGFKSIGDSKVRICRKCEQEI